MPHTGFPWSLLGIEAGALAAWLDELLAELSVEAKRRNLAASEPPQ